MSPWTATTWSTNCSPSARPAASSPQSPVRTLIRRSARAIRTPTDTRSDQRCSTVGGPPNRILVTMLRLRAFLRTYWTRGVPDRPTPESVQVLMLRWWLVALLFKLLGSSWDVSWHFKWLRDDLAPPHLLNTVGTGIAIALILTHSF